MEIFQKYRGIIGTVTFHALLIALMLYLHFSAPFPPPPEDGILINFGTNEIGMGNIEPQEQTYSPPVENREEQTSPPVQSDPEPPVKQEVKAEEQLMTQDVEDAPVVKTAAQKKKEEDDRILKEELDRKRLAEIEKARVERLERERIETERKRQEEIERQRVEAERKKQEEQQQQRNAISERMSRSFGGAADNDSKAGEGVGSQTGNQGSKTGSANSTNRSNEDSKGSGVVPYLEGRNVIGSLAKPEYKVNDYGTVVVTITVDKEGMVTSAVPGAKGSTTTDSRLWEAAKKAAIVTRFNKLTDPNAPLTQKGTIIYQFRLL